MKKLLGKVLWRFSNLIIKIGDSINGLGRLIRELALRFEFPLESIDVVSYTEELKDLFPHSFYTFKEGMESRDYVTRHDAAAKLVGWYLHQDGHPLADDMIKAARVLLEDSKATEGDVSYLVGAWMDQASAKTQEEREVGEERENKIYNDVFKSEV